MAGLSRYVRYVFWLRQPPYLRWIVAAVVLAIGIFLDTRPAALVRYPYVADDLHAGELVAEQIEWRRVPVRLLPDWDNDVAGYAITDIAAGTPLLPELVAANFVPDGWWSVALVLPHAVAPGTQIRAAIEDSLFTGIVSGEVVDDGFELIAPVAFTAEDAAAVAAALGTGAVVVIIGSPGPTSASSG